MRRTIQKAAVLGAGVMGSAIAALLAGAGVRVVLLDILPGELTPEEREMGFSEESLAYRNHLAQLGLKRMLEPKSRMLYHSSHADRIELGNMTDHMNLLADCDWIIEVVPEKLDIKLAVMRKVQQFRKPDSIVSTNTSGISIHDIAAELSPELQKYFLGVHFFNPPRYMHLLEIIPTADTDPGVLADMTYFVSQQLGKGVVFAKDTPNFIANRIGGFVNINAMQLMMLNNLDIPTVDQLTGAVLGRPATATFGTADMVGLDILANVSDNIRQSDVSEHEKEQYTLPDYIKQLIGQGALGNKTGRGCYKKSKKGGVRETRYWNPRSADYEPLTVTVPDCVKQALASDNKYAAICGDDSALGRFAWQHLKSVLLYCAEKVPEITDDYTLIDQAMVWGYNWEMGPFAIWDKLGFSQTVRRMQADGDKVPEWVLKRLADGQNFYEEKRNSSPYIQLDGERATRLEQNEAASLWDIGDGVIYLDLHSKQNAISELTITMLETALEVLQQRQAGMVLGSRGKLFSAGADLNMVAALIERKDWRAIETLCKRLQDVNMALKYSGKPVVAAPFGTTVGGGAEIVMHCAGVTAYAETYMGLVEAGVGLVPGGGGCKELLWQACARAGSPSRQTLLPALQRTWRTIAAASVSTSAHDGMAGGQMDRAASVVMNKDALLDEAKIKALELSYKNYMPPLPVRIPLLGEFGKAAIQYELQSMQQGGFVSEYDAFIGNKIAHILTGGNVLAGTEADETYLLELEREAFVSLCGEEKTGQRIAHMLAAGKPLRN